ncbi:hypothetical protein [Fusobacterium sp.]|uniref:hypothetical protein n=1 Tax=Fusobacterium sp. TaxID=68766 RepID=UPI002900B308|nr:hypothetical protein [Fusobacterium sp.]MDU1911004.1 hypothetical protein [Fusobacterium sp.]
MFNNFFKREKDIFFSLEDIKNIKRGILVLESEYFEIIKIILEEDLDEREREYEIEEQLENRIINYEAVDYVEKEIFLEKKDGTEEILIILIRREKIYEIADRVREKNIELKGIIPVFLLKYLSDEEKKNEIFLDMGISRTSAVAFKDNKLKDIVTIDIEKDEALYSQEEFDELLERITFSIEEENFDNIEKITIYEKDRELENFIEKSELYRKETVVENWKNYEITFNKSFDFIPLEYKKRMEQRKYIKYGLTILAMALIIEFFLFFFFTSVRNNEMESIENLEIDLGNIKERIEKSRQEIKKIENFKDKKSKLMKKMDFGRFKMYEILEELKKCKSSQIYFDGIEYDGKNTLKIIGKAAAEKEIYEFEKNILKNNNFFYLNHDYIKKQEYGYEFQMDIGVKNEGNK